MDTKGGGGFIKESDTQGIEEETKKKRKRMWTKVMAIHHRNIINYHGVDDVKRQLFTHKTQRLRSSAQVVKQ